MEYSQWNIMVRISISLAYFEAQIKFDVTKTDLKLNQQRNLSDA